MPTVSLDLVTVQSKAFLVKDVELDAYSFSEGNIGLTCVRILREAVFST